jgi:hypothetical protein
MKWINRLYIFFLGIILTITTGFGVAAFYPQPTSPVYPSSIYTKPIPESCNSTPSTQATAECQVILEEQQKKQIADEQKRIEYDQAMEIFRNKNASYTRTAIFFGIVIGAIFAILGIIFIKKSKLVATGLLLASVLTAILTRMLISLASLGASVSGTREADTLAYMEFGVLFVLSIAVILVGQFKLSDNLGAN